MRRQRTASTVNQARRVGHAASLLAVAIAIGAVSSAAAVAEELPSEGLFAVFETSMGRFVCELEYRRAPVTVGNFVGLAEGTQEFLDPRTKQWVRRPFYDGLKFHRVVKGFVVQGGDPLGDGTGGPGYAFMDEFTAELRHDRPGILSMANAGPATNGSQFFITLAPLGGLDNRHSVFGSVVSGLEVLQGMASQPMMGEHNSTPVTDIVMRRVTIHRNGAAAQAFDARDSFARQAMVRDLHEREKKERAALFSAELQLNMAAARSTSSGIRYVELQPGSGAQPAVGQIVTTHYEGFLEDGSRFDSSHERGAPFRFTVGRGEVIKGWDELFLLMHKGQKVRVIIPPALAYGKQGNRRYGIPADATLVFDVELVDIQQP